MLVGKAKRRSFSLQIGLSQRAESFSGASEVEGNLVASPAVRLLGLELWSGCCGWCSLSPRSQAVSQGSENGPPSGEWGVSCPSQSSQSRSPSLPVSQSQSPVSPASPVPRRLFAFLGTCGFCVLGLMVNPPKSSYWQQRPRNEKPGVGVQRGRRCQQGRDVGVGAPPDFRIDFSGDWEQPHGLRSSEKRAGGPAVPTREGHG